MESKLTSKKLQAGITATYILLLIDQLGIEDKHRGSIIKIRYRILPILRSLPIVVAKLTDEAYIRVAEEYKEAKLDIGILIETLAFNKEQYLKELFGDDIITLITRGSVKVQLDNLTKKQQEDSYKIADELKKNLEKVVFNYLKEKDNV